MNSYETETRERFGDTDAYREQAEKTKNYTKEEWASAAEGMDRLFAQFSACKSSGAAPSSDAAQALVRDLQSYITAHFYTCTDEILAGLGQMYTADGRFMQNIDRHGEGTASFASDAILAYCKGRGRA